MVHTRINGRASNPNPHINFISTLDQDNDALELLHALAAQLKPVMKDHGFTVNSFEEYETNKVFLGRNWNNGETIELVLKDESGRFYPISRLLGVFCHELAHIKHMNHSTAFHALRRKLCTEVSVLQRKGYFGDGYWSAGTRLGDSQRVQGDNWNSQNLPEYTCGGAYNQSRRSALSSRKRRRQKKAGPSNTTGAQTAKRRKAGSRVTSKAAFEAAGSGNVLDETVKKGVAGSGFGKKAASRRAREERALAAERRLMLLQGKTPPEASTTANVKNSSSDEEGEDEYDSDYERVDPESDRERLDRMRMGGEDLDRLRDDDDDVVFISAAGGTFTDPIPAAAVTDTHGQPLRGKESKRPLFEDSSEDEQYLRKSPYPSHGPNNAVASGSKPAKSKAPFGNLVKDEIRQRKRDAVGLDGTYKLDSKPKAAHEPTPPNQKNVETEANKTPATGEWPCILIVSHSINLPESRTCTMCEASRPSDTQVNGKWSCEMCTLWVKPY
ncbi:WLM domain-containing protein [Hysterangium stoloniferum]|nr:WLM domain-containing protein [Hysterangium stoloniferum]